MIRPPPLPLALAAAALAFQARAQDFDRIAPKLPPKFEAPALSAPPAPAPVAAPETPVISALKGLVFVAGADQLEPRGRVAPAGGLDLARTPELADPHFRAQLEPFFGKPLTLADLARLRNLTLAWLKAHGRPFADVTTPPQNVSNGVVQVVLTRYRLGGVEVEGARWFSPGLIRRESGLKPGRPLELGALQTDLDRLNANPFLTVDAVFKPGAAPGETDVVLQAHDRAPVRAYAGYDNLGVRSLGRNEFNLGLNWGNAFGLGQILSYQLTRSFSGRYTSHAVSDVIPLPWRDRLLVFGSYEKARPDIAAVFNDQGHSGQASLRYVHVLPRIGWAGTAVVQDVQAGYDYKTTDNNLEFSGVRVFATQAEVDQFPLIYDATVTDRLGQWAIQNIAVYSPGGLTADNTTAALATLVPGARSEYAYDRILVTRTTRLPFGAVAVTRATAQGATHNLPDSEQLGGGGVGSVRGYDTDTALGSEGELFSQELRAPAFSPSRLFGDAGFGDLAQVGAFFDYADLRQVTPIPDQKRTVDLASAGVNGRYTLGRFIDVQLDIGWRLRSAPTEPHKGSYAQVSTTIGF